jgi:hypothetical protein
VVLKELLVIRVLQALKDLKVVKELQAPKDHRVLQVKRDLKVF